MSKTQALPFTFNTCKFNFTKHGRISGYSYHLVDSDFEVMTSEQLNKKLSFTNVIKSPNVKTSPISMSNPLISSTSTPTQSNLTIPIEDLRLDESIVRARESFENAADSGEKEDAREKLTKAESIAENQAILEITLEHRLLEQNVDMLIYSKSMKHVFEKLSANIIPVYIYGIIGSKLSDADLKELTELKETLDNNPILFVKIPEIDKYLETSSFSSSVSSSVQISSSTSYSSSSSPISTSQNDSAQSQLKQASSFLKYLHNSSQNQFNNSLAIFGQLCDLKYLNVIPSGSSATLDYDYFDITAYRLNSSMPQAWSLVPLVVESEFCEKWHVFMPTMVAYLKRFLKSFSVRGTTILFKFHEYCLSKFINFAFEMARDMMITPKKIEYAREKEQILFDSLNSLASMKQEELRNLINNAIETNREAILNASKNFDFVDVELVSLDAENANEAVSEKEQSMECINSSSKFITVKYARDYKKCTSQIQELVINKLNNAIAQKLTESVEILKENYIGTLKRCLITLEDANNINPIANDLNSASVSDALQQILNAAYQVEVNLSGSSSILRVLIQRMKEVFSHLFKVGLVDWFESPI